MAEKHSISIDGKLYSNLKEYCELNNLKLNAYVEELIRKQFTIEKFGTSPFDKMAEVEPPRQEKKVIDEFYDKAINGMKEPEETTVQIVEAVGGPDKMQDLITDLIFDEKKEEKPVVEKPKKKVTRLN